MSNLKDREDYIFVSIPDEFLVDGETLPGRKEGGNGGTVLRFEDIALLREMVAERLELRQGGVEPGSAALRKATIHNLAASLLDNLPSEEDPTGVTDNGGVPSLPGRSVSWSKSGKETCKWSEETPSKCESSWSGTPFHDETDYKKEAAKATFEVVKASDGLRATLESITKTFAPSNSKNTPLDPKHISEMMDAVDKITHVCIEWPMKTLHGAIRFSGYIEEFQNGEGIGGTDSDRYSFGEGFELRQHIPESGFTSLAGFDCIRAVVNRQGNSVTYSGAGHSESESKNHDGSGSSDAYDHGSTIGWEAKGTIYTDMPAVKTHSGKYVKLVRSITCLAAVGQANGHASSSYGSTESCDYSGESSYTWEMSASGSVSYITVTFTATGEVDPELGLYRLVADVGLADLGLAGNKKKPSRDSTSTIAKPEEGPCKTETHTSQSTYEDSGSWFAGWAPYAIVELDPHAKP